MSRKDRRRAGQRGPAPVMAPVPRVLPPTASSGRLLVPRTATAEVRDGHAMLRHAMAPTLAERALDGPR